MAFALVTRSNTVDQNAAESLFGKEGGWNRNMIVDKDCCRSSLERFKNSTLNLLLITLPER